MSDVELDPLPPEVQRLLEAERPIPAAPAGLSPQLLHALASKLSAAGVAAPVAGSVTSGLLTKVVIAALAFSGGAGVMHWVDVERASPPAPIPLVSVQEVAPLAVVEQAPSGSLSDEQALIEQARAALSRGNGADAIAALEDHRLKFPSGQLAEHREALAVQALVTLGKTEEAQRRAQQFRERWPRSILLPVVDQAMGKKP